MSMPSSFVIRQYLSRPGTGPSGVQEEEPGKNPLRPLRSAAVGQE